MLLCFTLVLTTVLFGSADLYRMSHFAIRCNNLVKKSHAAEVAGSNDYSEVAAKSTSSPMTDLLSIPGNGKNPRFRIVRLTSATDDALAILEEYYEAVRVVQRDKPSDVQEIIDTPASGVWLAYMEDEVMGCVVLRKLETIPFASECKRLYVKPLARGNRIADELLDAQEAYARSEGIEWIYLDSYDDLKAAIAVYERRGYQLCERYNDNPQATLFLRKRIALPQG
jgi:GNAT superfamily N-acetyltransferase